MKARIVTTVLILVAVAAGVFWYTTAKRVNVPPSETLTVVEDAQIRELRQKVEQQFAANNPEKYKQLQERANEADEKIASGQVEYRDLIDSGTIAQAMGDYAKALNRYAAAAKLNPVGAIPWNNSGDIYIQLKRYSDAENQYLQWIKYLPGDETSYTSLANLYIGLKYKPAEDLVPIFEQGITVTGGSSVLKQYLVAIKQGKLP